MRSSPCVISSHRHASRLAPDDSATERGPRAASPALLYALVCSPSSRRRRSCPLLPQLAAVGRPLDRDDGRADRRARCGDARRRAPGRRVADRLGARRMTLAAGVLLDRRRARPGAAGLRLVARRALRVRPRLRVVWTTAVAWIAQTEADGADGAAPAAGRHRDERRRRRGRRPRLRGARRRPRRARRTVRRRRDRGGDPDASSSRRRPPSPADLRPPTPRARRVASALDPRGARPGGRRPRAGDQRRDERRLQLLVPLQLHRRGRVDRDDRPRVLVRRRAVHRRQRRRRAPRAPRGDVADNAVAALVLALALLPAGSSGTASRSSSRCC